MKTKQQYTLDSMAQLYDSQTTISLAIAAMVLQYKVQISHL